MSCVYVTRILNMPGAFGGIIAYYKLLLMVSIISKAKVSFKSLLSVLFIME